MQKLTFDNQTFEIPDLEQGYHSPDDGKYCAMEMIAYLAGEEHSDHPECVCPVITEFVRRCNDRMSFEARNRLLSPLLMDLIGTSSTAKIDQQRAFMLADWAVRTVVPIALRSCGHDHIALFLRKQPAIVDGESAISAANAAAKAAADTAADPAAYSAAYSADYSAEAAEAAAKAASYAYAAPVDTALCAAGAAALAVDSWDLVPGLVQKLISVGDREYIDLTEVAERARKLKHAKADL